MFMNFKATEPKKCVIVRQVWALNRCKLQAYIYWGSICVLEMMQFSFQLTVILWKKAKRTTWRVSLPTGLVSQSNRKRNTHQRQLESHAQFDAAVSRSECRWYESVWRNCVSLQYSGAEGRSRSGAGQHALQSKGHARLREDQRRMRKKERRVETEKWEVGKGRCGGVGVSRVSGGGLLARVPHHSDGVMYTEKPDLMWALNTPRHFVFLITLSKSQTGSRRNTMMVSYQSEIHQIKAESPVSKLIFCTFLKHKLILFTTP